MDEISGTIQDLIPPVVTKIIPGTEICISETNTNPIIYFLTIMEPVQQMPIQLKLEIHPDLALPFAASWDTGWRILTLDPYQIFPQ